MIPSKESLSKKWLEKGNKNPSWENLERILESKKGDGDMRGDGAEAVCPLKEMYYSGRCLASLASLFGVLLVNVTSLGRCPQSLLGESSAHTPRRPPSLFAPSLPTASARQLDSLHPPFPSDHLKNFYWHSHHYCYYCYYYYHLPHLFRWPQRCSYSLIWQPWCESGKFFWIFRFRVLIPSIAVFHSAWSPVSCSPAPNEFQAIVDHIRLLRFVAPSSNLESWRW